MQRFALTLSPRPMIRLAPAFMVFLFAVAGCSFRAPETAPISTPAAPVWEPETVGQTLRALDQAAVALRRVEATPESAQQAGRAANYVADQLHRYGLQPAAEAYRLHYPLWDGSRAIYQPLLAGLVAGRDPFRRDEVVVVYAAFSATAGDRTVAAAWLELGRAYAELVRFYRFPVRTVLFLMPVGAHHDAALAAYGRQPVWPLEQVQAVVALGAQAPAAEVWHALGIPDSAEVTVLAPIPAEGVERGDPGRAVELARRAYAWLLPYVGAEECETIL